MKAFSLRFPEKEISHWASRYSYASDGELENVIAPGAGTGVLYKK
jgi:hypothetical protein